MLSILFPFNSYFLVNDLLWGLNFVSDNRFILQGQSQRSCQRWLDKRIYKTELKFSAVLGSRGCREKKRVCADYEQLFLGGVSTFCGQKIFFFENIVASALKSCIEKRLFFLFLGGKNFF